MTLAGTMPSREILRSISVLYVEDDLSIQEQLLRFLRKSVGTVYAAANGEIGLKLYKKHKPDVIITDIRMPVLNGLEMAKSIRKIDNEIPIIVTTAFNEQEYFLKSIDIQVNKYVLKPTDPFSLVDALAEIAMILMQKKEKELNNHYIRFILDSQPNFMIATNKYEIEYINKTFLTFLGYSSTDDFKKADKRLEDFFLNIKGLPPSENENHSWLKNIINNPGKDVLISFTNRENSGEEPKIYLVACSRFPDIDKYFLSLTDITTIEKEKQDMEKETITDILTGVFNRKKLIDTLVAEINRTLRYKTPVSLIMLDIDHFKHINDTYGHGTGDQILQNFTRIVAKNIRASDTLARWGGDEFLIVTPEIDISHAKVLADKINLSIKKSHFGEAKNVTASFGVAQFEKNDNLDSFVKRADIALYKAKSMGRARVES